MIALSLTRPVVSEGHDPAEARPTADHGPLTDDGVTFYVAVGGGVDPGPPQPTDPHPYRSPGTSTATLPSSASRWAAR